jgi:hypothetical protein
MTLPSSSGQVDSLIANELLVAPHFADITLAPIKVAPKEGALAFDEKTQLLYYSRNYKWIPITGGGGSIVTPPGIVVQTTSPSGSTFTAVTIVSGNPSITVTNGNGIGGNPTITFNGQTFPQGLLSEQTAPNGTVVNGVTIVSASPQIVVTNGNGVGGNPTLTFNAGIAPLPALPQGIISEQDSPAGTTYHGVTITSIDPELVVTNGNGVGGNPTLNIMLTPVGKLLGGTVQTDVNYLGEVYNDINGFSVSAIVSLPVTSSLFADATSPATNFAVNSGQDYNSNNDWNQINGTFTVPISGRWLIGANILLSTNATITGSLITWNNIGFHNVPAFPAPGNNDGWGFSTLPHLVAGTVCMLNIGTIIGGFTVTLLAGSTIFARLEQPDA